MPGPTIPPTLAKAFIAFLSVLVVLTALFGFLLFGPLDIFSDINKMADLLNDSRDRSDRGRPSSPEVGPSLAREVSHDKPTMIDITTEPPIVSFESPGESVRLTLRGYYSDGTVGQLVAIPGADPAFTSTDPEVAQVSSDGIVTGLEAGGVDVEVFYGGFTAEVPVLVWGEVRQIPDPDLSKLLDVSGDGTAVLVNRVLAELKQDFGDDDAAELAATINGQVIFKYLTFPTYIIEFDSFGLEDLEYALEILKADRRIASAYPDRTVSASNGGPSQSSLPESMEFNAVGYSEAGMFDAWEVLNGTRSQTSQSLFRKRPVIVVIDSYFPPESMAPEVKVKGQNVMAKKFDYKKLDVRNKKHDGPLEKTIKNKVDHGISVTSILVAESNTSDLKLDEKNFSGVIPSVNGLDYLLYFRGAGDSVGDILPILVSYYLQELENLVPVQEQLDVVNMSIEMECGQSIGGPFIGWRDCNEQNTWARLMKEMPNVTFVTSAGNKNIDVAGKVNLIPASLAADRGNRRAVPNLITVGGLTGQRKADDSNFGGAVTIAAPFIVTLIRGRVNERVNENMVTREVGGTSNSAPLVAGTVALMRALDPDLKPEEIKRTLVETGKLTLWCKNDPLSDSCTQDEKVRALDAGAAVNYVLAKRPAPTPPPQPKPTVPIATPAQVPTASPTPIPIPIAQTVEPTPVSSAMRIYHNDVPAYSIGVPEDWIRGRNPFSDEDLWSGPNLRDPNLVYYFSPDRKAGLVVTDEYNQWMSSVIPYNFGPEKPLEIKTKNVTPSSNRGEYIEFYDLKAFCYSGPSEGVFELYGGENWSWSPLVTIAYACQDNFDHYETLLLGYYQKL